MFFMDTFFVTTQAKSVRGFTCMQLFVSDKGFVKVYGMRGIDRNPISNEAVCQRGWCTQCLCM
jgi:hypothetical protein